MRRPAAFIVVAIGLALLASGCAWKTKPLALDTRPLAQSSRIYAADGTLLTTLHAEQNRESVPLDVVPQVLRDAVIAIEDARFWQHNGVDAKSVIRAAYENSREGEIVEGGSTITQQYVKNELVGNDRNVRRKLREAALAYQLEDRYTKEKILELYLNTIYFGTGAYGVQAASHTYFGVPVDKLTLGQAALLAGLIRSPNTTNPYGNPDVALARRTQVLDRMVELKMISADQRDQADAEPLLPHAVRPGNQYPAPYFVERVKRFVLDDERFGATPAVRRNLLFEGGLRIETTLDLDAQRIAEDAVNKVLSKPATDPAGAVVSIEPRTGFVRALVGGRDFFGAGPQAKFDLATQGSRPAGSSFKPFVLAAAIEEGIPLTKVYDAPGRLSIPLGRTIWDVDNYEGNAGGRMNLIEATVNSLNTVYAQLILEVGPDDAVELAAAMGVATPLQPFPSSVLGTNDVTPLDMAAAYATFANRGLAVPPAFVTRVLLADGTVLYEHEHRQKRVMKQETSDAVVGVLQQAVSRGTGVGARIGRPAAGKTGTGQEWRDAWFVGFTPELATSVWIGFPDRQVSMVPPRTRTRVLGGSWPAQIWQLYTTSALADTPVSEFPPPPPLVFGADAPDVPVPDVVGMPIDPAESTLARDGFRPVRQQRSSTVYPPGYVISQTPAGGATVPGGSEVTVVVSTGPPATSVPDVLDMAEAEARHAVSNAGLKIRVVREAEPKSPGSNGRKGRVWKQSPQGGTPSDRGAVVTVHVNPA